MWKESSCIPKLGETAGIIKRGYNG